MLDPPVRPPDDPGALLSHRRLLGHRVYGHCVVRAAIAVTLVVASAFARFVLGLEDIDFGAFVLLAGAIAAYDVVAWLLLRRYRDPEVIAPSYQRVLAVTYAVVILDFLALTVALWLLGGCRSPFVAFYLLHVIVSAMLLSRRSALMVAALAYASLVVLVAGELSGLVVPNLPAGIVAGDELLEWPLALTVLVVFGVLLALTSFLMLGLTTELRRDERRIRLANAELERVSAQRRDFLHIAMHNIKAPLGAVSMFLENLDAGLAGPLNERQAEWVRRCQRRLEGLAELMPELQTLAALETDIVQGQFGRLDIESLVERVVEEYQDIAEQRGHQLRLEVRRPIPRVVGHGRLLREATVNYLSNAMKYTAPGGHIEVRLLYERPWVRLEVVDDGEGIAPGDQGRLFAEFVRLQHGAERGPDQGSGLGLSIVKRVIEAHGGRVGLESEPGQGSTFYFELPGFE